MRLALISLPMLIVALATGSCSSNSNDPGVCQPYEARCIGKAPTICAADGSRWVDRTACGSEEVCEDGACVPGSDPCGDGTCSPDDGESPSTCPADCAGLEDCGDDTCNPDSESCVTCPADCGQCCGDGTCSDADNESCATCPADCGQCCGNGTCDAEHGEIEATCPADCSCGWESDQVFKGEVVFGVWGDSPDNLFVLSESGCYRSDSGGWTGPLFTLPAEVIVAWNFMGTGPNDLWTGTMQGLLHYDGDELSVVGSPTASVGQLWVNGVNDVWYVGYEGSSEGYHVGHWQGSDVDFPTLPPGIDSVNTLWSDGAAGVWIGGSWTDSSLPLLLQYDSGSDTFVDRSISLGGCFAIDAIFGFGPDELLLVTDLGVLWRYIWPNTVEHLVDFSGRYFKLWASSLDRVVVVSWDGHLHEINTETEATSSQSGLSIIRGIWGLDAHHLWLATNNGLEGFTCQ